MSSPVKPGNRRAGDSAVEFFEISFETGEQGAAKIYFPSAARVTKIRGIVKKAIAATDAGTITAANASGAMASGVITCAISDPIATEYTVTPTTNTTIAAGSYITLTPAKTTAGGKVFVGVEYVSN